MQEWDQISQNQSRLLGQPQTHWRSHWKRESSLQPREEKITIWKFPFSNLKLVSFRLINVDLPSSIFWKGPGLLNCSGTIWPFPPSDGGNDENWGGNEFSKAKPCLSFWFASSGTKFWGELAALGWDSVGLNCGGKGSDAEKIGWIEFDCRMFFAKALPPRLPPFFGRRRTILPFLWGAPAIDVTRIIPKATV